MSERNVDRIRKFQVGRHQGLHKWGGSFVVSTRELVDDIDYLLSEIDRLRESRNVEEMVQVFRGAEHVAELKEHGPRRCVLCGHSDDTWNPVNELCEFDSEPANENALLCGCRCKFEDAGVEVEAQMGYARICDESGRVSDLAFACASCNRALIWSFTEGWKCPRCGHDTFRIVTAVPAASVEICDARCENCEPRCRCLKPRGHAGPHTDWICVGFDGKLHANDLPFHDYCAGRDCRTCTGVNCTCVCHNPAATGVDGEGEGERETDAPFGELYLDAQGEPHFICHTATTDFAATKVAINKFIALLQSQVERESECPYFAPPSQTAEAQEPEDLT